MQYNVLLDDINHEQDNALISVQDIKYLVNELIDEQKSKETTDTHSDELLLYANWFTKDKEVNTSALQKTYLTAWRDLDVLEEHKEAQSWLLGIFRREHARQFEQAQSSSEDIIDFKRIKLVKKELAKFVNVSSSAVISELYKARKRMSTLLGPKMFDAVCVRYWVQTL